MNNGSDTTIVIQHEQELTTQTADLLFPVDSIQIDPELWILKKVVSINGVNNHHTQMVIDVAPNPFTGNLRFVQPI
jgi:hypothetical protein